MYISVNEFLKELKEESSKTINVFKALNDDSLSTSFPNYKRTPGFLAWHVTSSLIEMPKALGVEVEMLDEKNIPASVKEIVDTYTNACNKVYTYIENNLKDENLLEELDMYGEIWKKGFLLEALIKHEIHHRAQLTVLMRMAGLKVPGSYGPSEEEWMAFMQSNQQ